MQQTFVMTIWFLTTQSGQPIPFVHLVYLWSKYSCRLDADPFLSYRASGKLKCLLYSDIQKAVKSSASHFGLSEEWFNTQSIRMSAPTIAMLTYDTVLHCDHQNQPLSTILCIDDAS